MLKKKLIVGHLQVAIEWLIWYGGVGSSRSKKIAGASIRWSWSMSMVLLDTSPIVLFDFQYQHLLLQVAKHKKNSLKPAL